MPGGGGEGLRLVATYENSSVAFSVTVRVKPPLRSVVIPFAVPVSKTVAPMIGWPFVSITLPEISIVLESWVSATGAGDSAAVAELPPPCWQKRT